MAHVRRGWCWWVRMGLQAREGPAAAAATRHERGTVLRGRVRARTQLHHLVEVHLGQIPSAQWSLSFPMY